MGCAAFFAAVIFVIALPDYPAVLIRGVPGLGTVHTATIPAEDFA